LFVNELVPTNRSWYNDVGDVMMPFFVFLLSMVKEYANFSLTFDGKIKQSSLTNQL